MIVLETDRLILRRMGGDDAPFILELLNEPSFLQHIGDKGVRTLEEARQYILSGPVTSYDQHGFGLYRVELKASGEPIGMCGLLKRDWLADVDIGFAFLPRFWSKGYAAESALAVLDHGRQNFGVKRIVAISSPDNDGSAKVLEKIGLKFERMARVPGESSDVRLFASD